MRLSINTGIGEMSRDAGSSSRTAVCLPGRSSPELVRSKSSKERIRDNSPDPNDRVRFTPSVLPAYLRRTNAIEELIPWLYLKGISTNDFGEALQALVGEQAKGLSPNVIVQLKEQWADGIYAKVRLEDDANQKQCMLVLMGATADGKKELIAVLDGYRESKQSWRELLLDLKNRGLKIDPKLAVGDGALGFWAAAREVFPQTREQRCWVHKTASPLARCLRYFGAA